MISLCTEDLSMASLRGKIYTCYSDKELLVSYHIPFSNDPDTKITTYLLPLSKGYHVRVHKVELSRPYQVREGGFSIGTSDDAYKYSEGALTYKEALSKINVTSSCDTVFELQNIHPGMHNLRPMAYYPTWKTAGSLSAGEYVFASTVFFSDGKIPVEEPSVQINGNIVTVSFEGKEKALDLSKEVF